MIPTNYTIVGVYWLAWLVLTGASFFLAVFLNKKSGRCYCKEKGAAFDDRQIAHKLRGSEPTDTILLRKWLRQRTLITFEVIFPDCAALRRITIVLPVRRQSVFANKAFSLWRR